MNGGTFDVHRAIATSRAPKARVLTQADIDAGTYTIFDVVLPLPGFATLYPEGHLGDRYKEIMRADGIDPDDMFRKQKEYSLVRSRGVRRAKSLQTGADQFLTLVDLCPSRIDLDQYRAARTARLYISPLTSSIGCSSTHPPMKTSNSQTRTSCWVDPLRKWSSTMPPPWAGPSKMGRHSPYKSR